MDNNRFLQNPKWVKALKAPCFRMYSIGRILPAVDVGFIVVYENRKQIRGQTPPTDYSDVGC